MSDLAVTLFQTTYRPLAVADEVIAENHRVLEQQLAALRFYDLKANVPTHAAILLFGADPVFFVPGAYVQYVRYAGLDQAAEVTGQRRIAGDLLTVMRALDQLAQEVAGSRPVRIAGGLSEVERFKYPPVALHELWMNAVIHRSYESNTPTMINHFDDRIEILNPGGLYGDLTPEQFSSMTAYRNPVIAEAAKVLGFVNKYGRGIDIVNSQLAKNGSPPARFDLQANHFIVVVMGGA